MLQALRVSRGRRSFTGVISILVMLALGAFALAGCGGSSNTPTTHQTGTTNILVTATSGSVTKTAPLTVNFQ